MSGVAAHPADEGIRLVSLRLGDLLLGLPIAQVRDVFQIGAVTPAPLADPAVSGLVNLRGRIVPLLSLGVLLGLPPQPPPKIPLAVGVEWRGEIHGIRIDAIGDVLTFPPDSAVEIPGHITAAWARYARCLHKLDTGLLVELDLNAVLDAPLQRAG